MKKVILEAAIHPDGLARLQKEVEVIPPPANHEELAKIMQAQAAEGLITSSALKVTAPFLASVPALQVVGRPGVGVDNVDLAAATAAGVVAVYTPDAPTESTAEHAIALLLALAKQVRNGDQIIRASGFRDRRAYVGTEVMGKTLSILGLGRIGRRVAEIAHAGLKMRCLAYDPYVKSEDATALGIELSDNLEQVLAEADFLTIHTPLLPATRGMIGADELALLKPTAYLINVARGPIVDETALLNTLRAGRIAGAGLDVFAIEPIPYPHPLLQLENVILTPHIASFTDDGLRKMGVTVAEQVLAVLRGEQPAFVANLDIWQHARRGER